VEKRRLPLLLIAFLISAIPLFADEPARKALVVGNGAYEAGALSNPANDAADVAKVLSEAGFDVSLAIDRSLTEMEADLREFKRSIGKGDTALFFYAGHGVQVDGENYLLPVDNGNIRASGELQRRAVNAQEYVSAMAEAGAKLNIVMLDACRDNPLPAVSRSANRGLAVMSAPRTSETVIVFATKAGDVASDGGGRNSTFTTAFLETVSTPDLGLVNLFNLVGAKVRTNTGGMQIPTIYSEPLSAPFSFFSASKLAAEARAESEAAEAEVNSLEADIAALKEKIASSRTADERQKLELEEQRQAALLAAQKMKAENLAREAERRETEAAAARKEAELLAAEAEAAAVRQNELERLASLRRTELDKLKSDAESENPDLIIATIERLEKVLGEVEAEYDAAWRDSEREIKASYSPRYTAFTSAEPEIWETDEEFAARIARERASLDREVNRMVSTRKEEAEAQKAAQTASIRQQLQDALSTLSRKRWTLSGNDVALDVGAYDRNERTWPFTVRSLSAAVPVPGYRVVTSFTNTGTLKDDLVALDSAVKAGALAAEIEWRIDRKQEQVGGGYYGYAGTTVTKYYVVLQRIMVKDITADNASVAAKWISTPVASFQPGKRSEPASLWKNIKIVSSLPSSTIYDENNAPLGSPPVQIHALEGSEIRVTAKISGNGSAGLIERTFTVTSRQETYDVYDFKVGDTGPAGGIVYYDKGRFSDGWRYLEAAPASTEWDDKQWGGYRASVGGTSTAIGSGGANTEKIVSAYGYKEPYNGKTDYAAKLCADLKYGGCDDWFLPSKDELDKMYQNLKSKGIGGFASEYYWSSSEDDSYYAWDQRFSSGSHDNSAKSDDDRVRASRAF
jgi:uncharacterized caspase-like protein